MWHEGTRGDDGANPERSDHLGKRFGLALVDRKGQVHRRLAGEEKPEIDDRRHRPRRQEDANAIARLGGMIHPATCHRRGEPESVGPRPLAASVLPILGEERAASPAFQRADEGALKGFVKVAAHRKSLARHFPNRGTDRLDCRLLRRDGTAKGDLERAGHMPGPLVKVAVALKRKNRIPESVHVDRDNRALCLAHDEFEALLKLRRDPQPGEAAFGEKTDDIAGLERLDGAEDRLFRLLRRDRDGPIETHEPGDRFDSRVFLQHHETDRSRRRQIDDKRVDVADVITQEEDPARSRNALYSCPSHPVEEPDQRGKQKSERQSREGAHGAFRADMRNIR